MLRSFLRAPCLLICLACATPFPTESLEEGMTYETVREKFGAPETMEIELEGVDSSWTYQHEEQNWFFTVHPLAPLFIPIIVLDSDLTWPEASREVYVTRKPVILYFEQEKLARWEVIEPPPAVSSGISEDDWDWMDHQRQDFLHHQQEHKKDIRHHKKGHKHHHDHHDDDC